MKMTTILRTIRLALIALLSTSVVVACGPDKRKHRQPMKVGNKGIDPKTGLPTGTPQSPEAQKKAAEDLKNRSANISNIEGRIAQTKKGEPTDKNSMGEGTYTLEGVVTYFKYINTSGKAADMRVYRESQLQNLELIEVKDAHLATGFVDSFADIPRFVETPTRFTVNRSRNPDWSNDLENFKDSKSVLIRTVVTQNTGKITHALNDTTQQADPSKLSQVSVINLLNAGTIKDKAYTIKDDRNKTVTMQMLKVSETQFKIAFDIDESANPLQARTIVLIFKVEKDAGAGNAGGAVGGGQAPAPTTGDSGGQAPADQPPASSAEAEAAAAAASTPAGSPPASAIPGFGADDDLSK